MHSSCVGYSHDIFKFLERTANVKFLCNGCLSADIRPKSTVDVGELKISAYVQSFSSPTGS